MKFEKSRNLVKFLLAMCVVFCVVGVIANGSQTGVIGTTLSIAFFGASIIVIAVWCKCPNCGKHIYFGLFNAVNCPRCKRNLITGAKSKGKKR